MPDDLGVAAASNDLAAVGHLLGARDVNAIHFSDGELPTALFRRPVECSLLDIAVGSSSMETTKCLLEFHGARPTRETLKQSLSTGNLELIRLMRERLPETEFPERTDQLQVAAQFHQSEVLRWLLRDATVFEGELLMVLSLERKLAHSLVIALENGFRPWWSRTRHASLRWRASAKIGFVSAPEGFSSEGGWWTDISGVVSALPVPGRESTRLLSQPNSGVTDGAGGTVSDSGVEWTAAALRNKDAVVKSLVLPAGVTAMGKEAVREFGALESVVFPAGCKVFGLYAFYGCVKLRAVSLPAGCRATGWGVFFNCISLGNVTIPVGCKTISQCSFYFCTSLRYVRIPIGCTRVEGSAFAGSGLKEVVTPAGCEIGCMAFQSCHSLTTATIGTGCTTLEDYVFSDCPVLVSLTVPSTLKSVGRWVFHNCPVLATIAIPKGCQAHEDAFIGCKTRVIEV
jgi:hypothetical protein